jgi:diguanylate cyclase (GGDEF)-like protein
MSHSGNHSGSRASPRPPCGAEGKVALLLCTADADLRQAWEKTDPPPVFRLETLAQLEPRHLASAEAGLVLLDAAGAASAEEPLAAAIRAHPERCVWTGPAAAIETLGAAAKEAYDVLVTPITPGVLGCRLAAWARNIERAAALDSLGRRVEELAESNNRIAARLAEAEGSAQALSRQHERLDQALRRIRHVAQLSHEINSLDLDQIVSVCVRQLPALVEARRASLYLYDAAGDRLILQGHSGDRPVAERVDLLAESRSPMATAVRQGRILLIGGFKEFEQANDLLLEREFRDAYDTDSCIVVPLKGGGRVRGVLNLADKQNASRFDEEIDLPVIEPVAELIGASIYNVELYQEMERRAKTDALTELVNRRGVEEALTRESDRSRRHGPPLTVLMIDLDQLKDINDRFGHRAGDAALQNLAALLLDALRSVDVPGRWAGDEFLVVLPDTSAAQAERLVRRLLTKAHERPVTVAGQTIPASLSIGVAQYRKDETLESLIHRVDKAMYAAKAAGRDGFATAPLSD